MGDEYGNESGPKKWNTIPEFTHSEKKESRSGEPKETTGQGKSLKPKKDDSTKVRPSKNQDEERKHEQASSVDRTFGKLGEPLPEYYILSI